MHRRTFTKALLAGGLFLPLSRVPIATAAQAASPSLTLKAVTRTIEVNGKAASVFGLIGPDGNPGLSLSADQITNVDLVSELTAATMIHWHGLTPPWAQDGVPDMPLPLLKAGETRSYGLPGGLPGTHWAHAHSLQEQALLAAPLIVRGKDDLVRDEHEVAILLHDFSFKTPEELLAGLQSGGAMGSMQGMSMPMDLNDITYDAYLANDRTLDDPEVVTVDKGGMVRLRIINGATATAFTLDTGALQAQVIAVDGQDIAPLPATTFPLSMGQRVDFRFRIPAEGGAFPILALREGAPERTGLILATAGATIAKLPATGAANGPVLTLDTEAKLVSARPLATGAAAQSFSLDLFGGMEGYKWDLQSSAPLVVQRGERVEITFRNVSMMAHPMHLHGHHFQVIAINGKPQIGALRDTVLVPPQTTVTVAFDATNPGEAWALHCHHFYHMAAGMMTAVAYREG